MTIPNVDDFVVWSTENLLHLFSHLFSTFLEWKQNDWQRKHKKDLFSFWKGLNFVGSCPHNILFQIIGWASVTLWVGAASIFFYCSWCLLVAFLLSDILPRDSWWRPLRFWAWTSFRWKTHIPLDIEYRYPDSTWQSRWTPSPIAGVQRCGAAPGFLPSVHCHP